jgi:branched-chain amino acid transport system substrate-binding protein
MKGRNTGVFSVRAGAGPLGGLLCGMMLVACSTNGPSLTTTSALPTASAPSAEETDRKPRQVKVALLVPASAPGHSGLIGRSLKQAAELALFEHDNPTVQLIVKDDKGTPEGARAAAEEAVKGGAQLILGPLFAKSASAVAPVARQAGVPVVTFSTDRQVAGNGVYLLSYQPPPEVARVIDYAARRGKRRFAALVPDDAFGKLVTASFTEAVARAGGSVVALETYPATANGVVEPLRKVSAAIQRADAQGAPVDALFIPGGQESVELIARLLPQAEIDTTKIKLIGSGGMDYPNAGRDARLVGAWYPGPDPRGFTEFAQKFAKTYAAAPPRIAVLAHEAVGLAITLSAQADRQPFGPAQLTRAGGFSGIDGAYRLLPDGSTERALAILEVQKFGSGVIEPASSLSAVPSSPAGATSSVGGVLGGLLPKSILNLN